MNNSDLGLTIKLSIAALSCRIGALKATLNKEQLDIFNETLKKFKDDVIKEHEPLSPQHLRMIEELFR